MPLGRAPVPGRMYDRYEPSPRRPQPPGEDGVPSQSNVSNTCDSQVWLSLNAFWKSQGLAQRLAESECRGNVCLTPKTPRHEEGKRAATPEKPTALEFKAGLFGVTPRVGGAGSSCCSPRDSSDTERESELGLAWTERISS